MEVSAGLMIQYESTRRGGGLVGPLASKEVARSPLQEPSEGLESRA